MNIVLLNACKVSRPADHLQRVDPHPRVGVAVIAACLRRAGHQVRVLDPLAGTIPLGPLTARIMESDPDIVGLSAYTEEIADAAAIAQAVKTARPQTRTVAGGYHASAAPLDTLREFPPFDMAVTGEGESPMLELAAGQPPENIAGFVWRDHGETVHANPQRQSCLTFDELPPPAWDLYDLAQYGRRLPVEASRTCPFRCSFCYQATADKTRYKAPEAVVDEVEEGIRRHGARELSFASAGAFPLNRDHGMAVCNGMISRNLRPPWFTTTRADVLDRELLTAMRNAGCTYVSLGIETGDQNLLSQSNKRLNLEKAEATIRQIHEVGIESELCFILGLPGETPESLAKTRRFAMKMRPYATLASFAILTPFPGTDVFRMAESGKEGLGLVTRDWRLYSKHGGEALRHGAFTVRQLKRWQARLYLEFYLGSPAKALRLMGSERMREILSLHRVLALIRRML